MSKRIQRKRTKDWRMPPNTVYVGRPSKWGNPFKIGRDGSRGYVLYLYDRWLSYQLMQNPSFLEPLKEKDLACWCRLDEPCHADILLGAIAKEAEREK